MSKVICIAGESGSGKTTSMRNLDPKSTYYIDADKKGLSWKGWRKQYNKENKNYFACDDASVVRQYIKRIAEACPGVKVIVVDENEWRIIDKDNQYLNLEKGEITKVIIGYKVSASVRDIIIKKCNAVGIEAEIGFIDINNCGFVEVEAPLYIKMMKDIKTGEYQGGGYEIYKEKYR